MLRITRLLAASMLVLAVGLIGLSARSHAAPTAKTVTVRAVDGNEFAPATVTINVGDTVTWVNDDPDTPHNSVSNDDLWDSGNLESGAEYSFTFDKAGTYPYVCTYHPGMNGTVIVRAAGAGDDQQNEDTDTGDTGDDQQDADTDTGNTDDNQDEGAGSGDEHEGEMPEHAPDAGAGGLASGGLPLGQIAAMLSLLLASSWFVIRKQ
jgi:plastocyanin